ncbi:MAG TPA: hypothetical protein VLC98_13630 [Phnomibacter sp.]|nr:hypothetical protein [Phnomibacter sp.]
MTKRIFLLIFCLNILPFYIFAQQKWKLGFIAEAGLLLGSQEPSGDLRGQFLLQKNNWQWGVGSGVDFYRFQSVPVYAQGRKYFSSAKSKPFVLASAGYNIATPTELQKNNGSISIWSWPVPPSDYSGGWYAEAGVGYAIMNKKGRGVTLSLAYVFKSIEENLGDLPLWGDVRYNETNKQNIYYMTRLALRVGYKF